MDKLNLAIAGLEDKDCAVRFTLVDPADVKKSWYDSDDGYSAVNPKYIKGYATIYFKFDDNVCPLDISDSALDISTKDFFDRKYPCLILIPQKYVQDYENYDFEDIVKDSIENPDSPIISIYYGDKMADVLKKFYASKSVVCEDWGGATCRCPLT